MPPMMQGVLRAVRERMMVPPNGGPAPLMRESMVGLVGGTQPPSKTAAYQPASVGGATLLRKPSGLLNSIKQRLTGTR